MKKKGRGGGGKDEEKKRAGIGIDEGEKGGREGAWEEAMAKAAAGSEGDAERAPSPFLPGCQAAGGDSDSAAVQSQACAANG